VHALRQLRDATIAARQRTGNPRIGVHVHAGKLQVVLVEPGRKVKVEPVSDWGTIAQTIATLQGL